MRPRCAGLFAVFLLHVQHLAGCIDATACVCVSKFEEACVQHGGVVMPLGGVHSCVAADGRIVATWDTSDGGGAP